MNLKMRIGFICFFGPVITLVALAIGAAIIWFSENTISISDEDCRRAYAMVLTIALVLLPVAGALLYLDGDIDESEADE